MARGRRLRWRRLAAEGAALLERTGGAGAVGFKYRALAQPADLGLVDRPGAAAVDEPGRCGGGLCVFARREVLQVEHAMRLGRG